MALHKVCSELGLRCDQSEDDTKAVLATKGVTYLNDEQSQEALDCIEEEHHVIVFI